MILPYKKAACCLVLRDNKILAVSRKYDQSLWGLPGGSVETSELTESAALRELYEETGMNGQIVKHLYTGYDSDSVLVSTFLIESEDESLKKEDNTHIKWCPPRQLIDESPFSHYNVHVINSLISFGYLQNSTLQEDTIYEDILFGCCIIVSAVISVLLILFFI